MSKLTPKEERYCQELFNGKSQRQAYYIAYPESKKWKPETVDNKACELAKKNEILGRLFELKSAVTYENILSKQELLKVLSDIANDEEHAEKDRIAAAKELISHYNGHVQKIELSGNKENPVQIKHSASDLEEYERIIQQIIQCETGDIKEEDN
jgi:phage terminase small subunit